jgi:hypothetical protein
MAAFPHKQIRMEKPWLRCQNQNVYLLSSDYKSHGCLSRERVLAQYEGRGFQAAH